MAGRGVSSFLLDEVAEEPTVRSDVAVDQVFFTVVDEGPSAMSVGTVEAIERPVLSDES